MKRVRFIPPDNSPLIYYSWKYGEVIDETETRFMIRIKIEGYRRRAPCYAQISAVKEHCEVVE